MGSELPMMRAASSPAFAAPLIAIVATGMPAGIWTIDSSESRPSRRASCTGTPMTGRVVTEATMPGRWAAPPAPAMTTRMPRPAASRPKRIILSGVRCADTTSAS